MKYVKAGDKRKDGYIFTQEDADRINPLLAELATRTCGMPRMSDGKPCQRHIINGVCPAHEVWGVMENGKWVASENKYNAFAFPILEQQQRTGLCR